MNKEIYSKYIDDIKDMNKEELINYILQMYEAIQIHNGVEDKYKKEIDKLTAESTEWEERTYCWQDRAENLQIVLDKIKEDLIKTKKYNKVNDNNYINIDLDHLDYLLELLEEIE